MQSGIRECKVSRFSNQSGTSGKIWQILDEDSEIDGGVTRLTTGDLALRIFGHRAQKLQQVAEKIKKLYETEQR